ncbi:LysM peptidoglycan-binding domain-containing protein [Bacillus benzoevorans]|uniref:LysM repeat protein n=1 Tax=Bacillus benzoevorans TaxID=1456 RepID=A0A7X0LXU9_9BACI|nr:LysM peptidoglycan-binding domain-containing protein [Bacillus benzoevorans]MBB6446862.1 LysM repeat protein [Bacillus benzoevorans]
MTFEKALYREFTLSRKETYGKNKKKNNTPVFTSRMEKHDYFKGTPFFDIRNVIDVTGFLKDIKAHWNTYVSQVNRLIQHNPIKKLVMTGIFTIVLGISALHPSAAIVPEYTYQVKAGEKVDTIAQAHGVTAHEIYAANGISTLNSGQKLLLPKVEDMSVSADTLNIRSQPTVQGSVVGFLKKGQVVKVSFIENGWAAIMMEGRIRYVSADYLSKNAEKNIIAASSSAVYTIKPGDTFYKISQALGVSISSIQNLNPGVEPSKLKVGQSIQVPNAAGSNPAKKESIATISQSVYVIQPGDTFYKISKELGVTVASIQELNPGVEPAKLKVGQSINLSSTAAKPQAMDKAEQISETTKYAVKSGDTLYKISKTLGVSVSSIQEMNPAVDPGKLQIGQPLNIPAVTASEVNHIEVDAHIIDADSRGKFLFSTVDGSVHSAEASGVLLNELIEHKGEKLLLTLKGKRGQEMFLAAIH